MALLRQSEVHAKVTLKQTQIYVKVSHIVHINELYWKPFMDATSTLGSRLREERKRLGLLQPAFAEVGGVKRVTQHLYEQDERVPDANYLLRVHAHGADIGYILLGIRNGANAVSVDMNVLCDIYRAHRRIRP